MGKEEMEQNANKELKRQIFALQQELETMKRQKKMDEDDLGILDTEIATKGGPDDLEVIDEDSYGAMPMGPDPNSVALESSNDKPMEQQPQFIAFKNEMEDKLEKINEERNRLQESNENITGQLQKLESQINELNDEVNRVSRSKIELLINTSKEIDALRKLLSDYVQLAKRQREKIR